MTATNHMLAGAVVAVGVQNPFLIVPLAVASHFLLDVLPHFGIRTVDAAVPDKHPLFRYIVIIDIALAITLLTLLPSILKGAVSWWVLWIGMGCAFLPDFIWVYRFAYEAIHKKQHTEGRFAKVHRFHAKIQWGERPWGFIIEIAWFGAMGVLLGLLAS